MTEATAEKTRMTASHAAPVEAPAAAAPEVTAPDQGAETGEAPESPLSRKKKILAALGAVAIFAAITGSLTFIAKRRAVDHAPKPEHAEHAESRPVEIDHGLSSGELLKLAQGAIAEQDWPRAEELLLEARGRYDGSDPDMDIAILEALAKVADETGKTNVARVYRETVAGRREALGSTLPLFTEGERLIEEGKFAEARRAFGKFLLQSRELAADGAHYARRAKLMLVEIAEKESTRLVPQSGGDGVEPEDYFVR